MTDTQAIDVVTFDFKGTLLCQRLYRLSNEFILVAKLFQMITVGNVKI